MKTSGSQILIFTGVGEVSISMMIGLDSVLIVNVIGKI